MRELSAAMLTTRMLRGEEAKHLSAYLRAEQTFPDTMFPLLRVL